MVIGTFVAPLLDDLTFLFSQREASIARTNQAAWELAKAACTGLFRGLTPWFLELVRELITPVSVETNVLFTL